MAEDQGALARGETRWTVSATNAGKAKLAPSCETA